MIAEEHLVPAIKKFCEVMQMTAGFFLNVSSEAQTFSEKLDAVQQKKQTKAHFKILKKKAESLHKHCSEFIEVSPKITAEVSAIAGVVQGGQAMIEFLQAKTHQIEGVNFEKALLNDAFFAEKPSSKTVRRRLRSMPAKN